jgi:hypothetical protein
MEDDERGPYRSDACASDPIWRSARDANSDASSDARRVLDNEGGPSKSKALSAWSLSEALQRCDKVNRLRLEN